MSTKSEVRPPSTTATLTPNQSLRVSSLFKTRQEKYAAWYALHIKAQAAQKELKDAEEEHWTYLQACHENLPLLDTKPLAAPAEPEAWKVVPLAEVLNQGKKALKLLAEKKLKTLGDLMQYCLKQGDFDNPLTTVEGIGEKLADKIEADLDAFWTAHPEYCRQAGEQGQESVVKQADFLIAVKDREDALEAIANCTAPAVLSQAHARAKGDWRRAAIAKQFEKVTGGPLPALQENRKPKLKLVGGLERKAEEGQPAAAGW